MSTIPVLQIERSKHLPYNQSITHIFYELSITVKHKQDRGQNTSYNSYTDASTRSEQVPPTSTVLFESVPDVAVEVVVAAEKQTTTFREGHGRYTTDDVVVGVHADLLVSTQVKQPTGGVV